MFAFLNETVGGLSGSLSKENLFSRIYKKWKGDLPDLENATLFRVLEKKKKYFIVYQSVFSKRVPDGKMEPARAFFFMRVQFKPI